MPPDELLARRARLTTTRERIERDHRYLAGLLGLRADIELIVYCVTAADLGEPSVHLGHGVSSDWPYPGFKPGIISIPVEVHALSDADYDDNPPPLHIWDLHAQECWPQWRTELWHEVCHQYQHEIVGKWNGKDASKGHTEGWPEAVHRVAGAVGCPRDVFYELMRSDDVPSGPPAAW